MAIDEDFYAAGYAAAWRELGDFLVANDNYEEIEFDLLLTMLKDKHGIDVREELEKSKKDEELKRQKECPHLHWRRLGEFRENGHVKHIIETCNACDMTAKFKVSEQWEPYEFGES